MQRRKAAMTASKLRLLRRKLGLSQHEMATLIDVRPNTLSCYERGVAPISAARAALIQVAAERWRRAQGTERTAADAAQA